MIALKMDLNIGLSELLERSYWHRARRII